MFFLVILVTISASVTSSYALCWSKYNDAQPYSKSFSHRLYSNDEDCTYYFQPSSSYTYGYFLEIKWTSFDVEGNMPSCSKDSVEVFLTSSYKSIGKYCSDNIGSSLPFDMYSYDGHAKIRLKSDSSNTRGGIALTYKLRRKSYDYLDTFTSTQLCNYDGTKTSIRLATNGWPYMYGSSAYSWCHLSSHTGSLKGDYDTRVVLMDVDLQPGSSSSCSSNDYIDVKESSSRYDTYDEIVNKASSINGKYCGTHTPRVMTATKTNVYLLFNHPGGSTISYRGFVGGFIIYKDEDKTNTIIAVGVTVGVFLLAIIGGIVYRRKRKSRAIASTTVTQAQSPSINNQQQCPPPQQYPPQQQYPLQQYAPQKQYSPPQQYPPPQQCPPPEQYPPQQQHPNQAAYPQTLAFNQQPPMNNPE
eukprot:Seg2808.2 transcript_id=Seg2808.2/GoldUCD/mRNA.D3Y31 product=Cubilin protein_id=Seg2808.2/GoldUCD/D3Y31